MDSDLRIGFLGAGRMASALARGWLQAGLVKAEHVSASDPLPQARNQFAVETGTTALEHNRSVVERSDILIVAVKPQNIASLLSEVGPHVSERHLVVSIAAGI